jgi:hypothetical protein
MDEAVKDLHDFLVESGIKNTGIGKYAVRMPIVVNGYDIVKEISFSYYRAIVYDSEIEDTDIEVALIDINEKTVNVPEIGYNPFRLLNDKNEVLEEINRLKSPVVEDPDSD